MYFNGFPGPVIFSQLGISYSSANLTDLKRTYFYVWQNNGWTWKVLNDYPEVTYHRVICKFSSCWSSRVTESVVSVWFTIYFWRKKTWIVCQCFVHHPLYVWSWVYCKSMISPNYQTPSVSHPVCALLTASVAALACSLCFEYSAIYLVSNAKILGRSVRLVARFGILWMIFFGPATDSSCAWKLSKLCLMREIPGRWVLQARIQNFQIKAAQIYIWRAQMNITWPIYGVSMHNYAQKVAQVNKTQGLSALVMLLSIIFFWAGLS
jgi:hypothetical protein